jgi:hypothetical protein
LSRRKRSKPILTVLNQHFYGRNHAIPEDFAGAGLEVRHFDGTGSGAFRDNAGYDSVALAEFDDFSSFEPDQQLAGIAELAKIYAGHELNVAQNVSHCQFGSINWLFYKDETNDGHSKRERKSISKALNPNCLFPSSA